MLDRAGIASEVIHTIRGEALWKWVMRGHWRELGVLRKFDVLHHVGGACHWRPALLSRLLGKPVVYHWIGTDVLNYRQVKPHTLRSMLYHKAAHQWSVAHLSDSARLSQELDEAGVQTEVITLLPKWTDAEIEPLPERFTVLSYWFDAPERKKFYGGDLVLQLADEFPDIQFHILAATGAGEPERPNVRFLGFRKDMDVVYREASALIRMPKHDSTGMMPVEMLMRGRYVIYNHELDGCQHATDLDGARQALLAIKDKTEPNAEAATLMKSRFNIQAESASLRAFYDRLFPPQETM